MPYMNCPACHLSIPVEEPSRQDCPRCHGRDGKRASMFWSPFPYQRLTGAPAEEESRDISRVEP